LQRRNSAAQKHSSVLQYWFTSDKTSLNCRDDGRGGGEFDRSFDICVVGENFLREVEKKKKCRCRKFELSTRRPVWRLEMTSESKSKASSSSATSTAARTSKQTGVSAATESEAADKAHSERVWENIHSVLRNSQPDEPVCDWADAPTEFRIGDSSSPQPTRSAWAELTPPRMSRSSSTSSTSSAASLPASLSGGASATAPRHTASPAATAHDRGPVAHSKSITTVTDV
jgi:hypothetical protein